MTRGAFATHGATVTTASETLRVGGVRGQGQEALHRTPSPTVRCWLCCLAAQLCFTLCDPVDCSPPGSSVHGILQASILEWVPIPFSRGFSGSRDQTHVSCTAGRFFTTEPPGSLQRKETNMEIQYLNVVINDNQKILSFIICLIDLILTEIYLNYY